MSCVAIQIIGLKKNVKFANDKYTSQFDIASCDPGPLFNRNVFTISGRLNGSRRTNNIGSFNNAVQCIVPCMDCGQVGMLLAIIKSKIVIS